MISQTTPQIRILLVDDHQVMRDGLKLLLHDQADCRVVAEAQHGREALERVEEMDCDIVVMDIAMPELNGIEATRQLLARRPEVRVVALSMYSDQKVLSEMLKAGARGFVVKGSASEELIEAIRTVFRGGQYLSPQLAEVVDFDFKSNKPGSGRVGGSLLTSRELEVLQLVAEGGTTKSIGVRLNISAKTVDTHRQNIMKKLNLRTVAELTKFAVREGITSLQF